MIKSIIEKKNIPIWFQRWLDRAGIPNLYVDMHGRWRTVVGVPNLNVVVFVTSHFLAHARVHGGVGHLVRVWRWLVRVCVCVYVRGAGGLHEPNNHTSGWKAKKRWRTADGTAANQRAASEQGAARRLAAEPQKHLALPHPFLVLMRHTSLSSLLFSVKARPTAGHHSFKGAFNPAFGELLKLSSAAPGLAYFQGVCHIDVTQRSRVARASSYLSPFPPSIGLATVLTVVFVLHFFRGGRRAFIQPNLTDTNRDDGSGGAKTETTTTARIQQRLSDGGPLQGRRVRPHVRGETRPQAAEERRVEERYPHDPVAYRCPVRRAPRPQRLAPHAVVV